jgi:polyhydroxybutyrate depolymerase
MGQVGLRREVTKRQWRTIEEVRKLNGCGEGQPWGENCTLYPSKSGTPVVTYIHSGGHQFPQDVPPIIVKFFKQHAKQ